MDAVVEKAADRADKLLGESSKDGASAEAIKASTQAEEAFEKVKGELKTKFPQFEDANEKEVAAYDTMDAVVEKAADHAEGLFKKSEESRKNGASDEVSIAASKASDDAEEAFEKVKDELKEKFPQFETESADEGEEDEDEDGKTQVSQKVQVEKKAEKVQAEKKAAEEKAAQASKGDSTKVQAEKKAAEEKEAQTLQAAQAETAAAKKASLAKAKVEAIAKADEAKGGLLDSLWR